MLNEDQLYIDKTRTLPQDQDFNFLREEGLKYIENLSSDIWTDYNTHDPGITILEALCYAITELGYRTDFDLKDLIADKNGNIDVNQAFFTAKNILAMEPLSITDYRKLLADIAGVKNAWLYPYRDEDLDLVKNPEQEVPFYAHCKKDRLVYNETEHPVSLRGLYQVILDLDETDEFGDLNNGILVYQFAVKLLLNIKFQLLLPDWDEVDYQFIMEADADTVTNITVAFGGNRWKVGFDVSNASETKTIEFEVLALLKSDVSDIEATVSAQLGSQDQMREIFALYQKKIQKIIDILTEAHKTLNMHRNLCEDFLPLKTVCTQEIAFCADIEVESDADVEEVYANVLYELQNYLNPEIRFYTLQELLKEGIPSEEIFNGPILKHGFIKSEELEGTQIRTKVLVSDIINFIMDIDGVLAVKNVLLTKYDDEGRPVLPSQRWCLEIDGDCKPLLNMYRSKVLFFKGKLPFKAKLDETLDTLKYLNGIESRNKLKGTSDDFKMIKGRYRDPEDYYSIQFDFPMTYGIGKFGLPDTSTEERIAQSKQLKAYLSFIDQVLANFFSQLAHAKDVFSTDENVSQTYFGQYLDEVRDIEDIYVDPATLEKIFDAPQSTDPDDVISGRNLLLENKDTFFDRRNRFLDHLIARFAESFNEYTLMLYTYKNSEDYAGIEEEELIKDKIAFLKDYPIISKERGKAYDYLRPAWDTDNVSGLEKRLARLAGIDDFTRRFLFCLKMVEIRKTNDQPPKYYFQIVDEKGEILIKSTKDYDSYSEITTVALKLSEVFNDPSSYKPVEIAPDKFSFEVVDENDIALAESGIIYPDVSSRDNAISEIAGKLATDCPGEGMHLVEHLLLRPRFFPPKIAGEDPEDTYKLFEVCLDDCSFCGEEDPYSFRLSLILPYWHERFESMEFRRYFETLARTETPAHCMIKICWINNTLMNNFERAFKEWMEALADYQSDLILKETKQERLRLASNNMIGILTIIHSEYPEAHLFDCEDGTMDPVLLNNSILGTYKI